MELEFWQLDQKDENDEISIKIKLLQSIFDKEPDNPDQNVKDTFKLLGPINLKEWVDSKKVSVNKNEVLRITNWHGQCNPHKKEDGIGRFYQTNGGIYDGIWRNGEADGYGRFI